MAIDPAAGSIAFAICHSNTHLQETMLISMAIIAMIKTAPTAPPMTAPTFDSTGSSGCGVPVQAAVLQSGAVVKRKNGLL